MLFPKEEALVMTSKQTLPYLTDHIAVSDRDGVRKDWCEVQDLGWDAVGAHLKERIDAWYDDGYKVYWCPESESERIRAGDSSNPNKKKKLEALKGVLASVSCIRPIDRDLVLKFYSIINSMDVHTTNEAKPV